jgi:hypothetical protein
MRMAASADGRRVGFGWLGFSKGTPRVTTHADALDLWQVNPNQKLWSAPPTVGTPPKLPDPAADFAESAKEFRLGADALVPGHVTAAVALNRDGSRVAVTEYGVWGWVRNAPAIGKWDPPIHVLNFLPKHRWHNSPCPADTSRRRAPPRIGGGITAQPRGPTLSSNELC